MNNSNFNPNEEIEAMKTTDAAETPVDEAPVAEQAAPAEATADTTVSEPEVQQETVVFRSVKCIGVNSGQSVRQ